MEQNKKIKSIASKLIHNIEVKEDLRVKLSEMFERNEQHTEAYKKLNKQFERSENNEHNLRYDLGELNARLNRNNEIEIY
jgi:hypothetical protein